MGGWGDLSCFCSRNGDRRRIGDSPEKPRDRRGAQAAPTSRGLAGQGIVLNEPVPLRESLRPGMGLVPSQGSQNEVKYSSAAIPSNLPAPNISPSTPFVSNSPSKTALEHDTTSKPSNVQKSEPEFKDVNFIQNISVQSSDENTIRFSV